MLSLIFIANAAFAQIRNSDARQKQLKYEYKVNKQDEKYKYGMKVDAYHPSGFMTVEEYNELSKYVDKPTNDDKPVLKNADLKYLPKPTYRILRYNDPPGSPELNITKQFYDLKQYNGQGIIAPDCTFLVYPVVYYYPNSASTASDLFVIPLGNEGSLLDKMTKVKTADRLPTPIVSTEKSVDNDSAFRTLTPVDFSSDSKQLLLKEKIGSSLDGIWKTNAIVYDFNTKTSYNLVEVRDAIIYYWKENKNLNLDDYRWDITPLGFLSDEPNRVAIVAYAYTGNDPINLGIWSVDIHGEQSRLISFNQKEIEMSMNGFKFVKDGVVPKTILKNEQKALKKVDKMEKKMIRKKEKSDLKEFKNEYKTNIGELKYQYKDELKDLKKINSLKGSTSENELPEIFREYKVKELKKDIKKLEHKIDKNNKQLKKLDSEFNK